MLIEQKTNKRKVKVTSFRIDEEIVNEFKELCKKHSIKQVTVIENAMKKAIEEIKRMEVENNGKQ